MSGAETVQVTTLDQVGGSLLEEGSRAYLKIDVQGTNSTCSTVQARFCPEVGAVELELALFSMYEGNADWRAICDRLAEEGFVFFAVDPGYTDWESGRLIEMDGLFVRERFAELH